MDSAKTSRSGVKMSCGIIVDPIKRSHTIQYFRDVQMIIDYVVSGESPRSGGSGSDGNLSNWQ
jgi:hypothetical protein